ncbi:class I SAM-dependent methyltransferase [Methylosarcina fibrata]|uniref:class I SAM-dependent methyltransferase n=1 Tax=Methylosarcina fibrata TaxID=105972 RepID=UPI00035C4F5D|nr:class I SAM-dependent methyltransferase [Methylosarcina fibrata]
MRRISLVDSAHDRIRPRLHEGDVAVDATVGNGFDTLFLLRQIAPSGKVFGFDVQQAALDSAAAKADRAGWRDCLILLRESHAGMEEKISAEFHGRIRACMFNLGYLPGSDKRIITAAETTLPALNAAARLLAPGGILTVLAYPGHPGGAEEARQVEAWCGAVNPAQFSSTAIFSDEHKASAPRLFVVRKKDERGF